MPANMLYKRCRIRSRAAGQSAPCRESQVSPGTCVWCFQRIPDDYPGPAPIGSVHAPVAALYRAAKQALIKAEARKTSARKLVALRGHVDQLYALAELESREPPVIDDDEQGWGQTRA